MKISVSILSEKQDYLNCINKINTTDSDYLHLDIMDNTFTDTISFSYDQAKQIINNSDKKVEVHLMSNNLDVIIDKYIALKPYAITFHFEACNDILKYIKKIKKNGIKVGLAINPETKLSEIYQFLEDIDIVLILGVAPGSGGQVFIESVLDKIKFSKKLKNNYSYKIEIDGGMNNKTIKKVKEYADIIVSGSYITNSNNYQQRISSLRC